MWSALKGISHIGVLTLTGGEPSLKPEAIRNLYQILVTRGITVGCFYVVTNAKSTYRRKEFLEALDKLHGWTDDPGADSLVVSQDQFHNGLRTPNMTGFDTVIDPYGYGDGYEEPREYFRPEQRRHDISKVLTEGRAATLGYGTEKPEEQSRWEVSTYDDKLYVEDQVVYVSSNGNVTSCCNMSYERIDKESKGNVNQQSLESIILGYCKPSDEGSLSGEATPELESIEA
jgi:MoaA/NifB/PqqE/SkfB family radical SAM enzyme